MSEKELECLRQCVADGIPLDQDDFEKSMASLLPEASPDAISKCVDFIEDCVDMGEYVDFVAELEPDALSAWFDSMLAGFIKLKERFGPEITTQVCALSLNNCVLYPYEMDRAAEEVQNGSDTETIFNLMVEGGLEPSDPVFPKLREVLLDEPQQKPNSEITF